MDINTKEFQINSRLAVKNLKVQRAARKATTNLLKGRNLAVAEVDNWEELRTQARDIKHNTLSRLDEYLSLLSESVTKAGGKVIWASTATEANEYIKSLARDRGVTTVVKGKSMATEEINLNHALEKAGISAVETDLGEYFIQMAGETPFHILAPAIHKTREDFGQLFAEKLNVPYEEDPQKLTRIARKALREKFLQADMGVTGANFGVAETGTIVIVENEGNQRLSTSLPKIHVVVMGMEKVIPSLDDLAVFLTLLPRSATGQKATSYVSFITGPRGLDEIDGPEELHLIILDNGRSRILRDEEMRESLYCIRCAACLNICPIYNAIGGHAYGWVYSGPIGSVITPEYVGIDQAKDLPSASTLCGACREVCPVKINIPHMLLNLRHKAVESNKRSSVKAIIPSILERSIVLIWSKTMQNRTAYTLLGKLARLIQPPLIKNGSIRKIPFLVSGWTTHRDLTPLASKPFRQIWEERLSEYDIND